MKVNSKTKKKKTHVPFRLNVVFFLVFLLFSVLILRLGMVQIVYGDDYKREIERTEDYTISNPVPRGKIFDRNGRIIVDNVAQNAITYTNHGASQSEMLKVAEKLAFLIEMDTDKVTERDKKDYWIMKNLSKAQKKVSKEERERIKSKDITVKEFNRQTYDLMLQRVTDTELKELNKHDLEVLAIYKIFNNGYAHSRLMVKNKGVTREEYAKVSENLQLLPGVDTTTDWERSYAFDKTLKTILGKVNDGVPREQLDYFMAREYSQNDRVGRSYIEYQYENVLHGQKAKVKNITDKKGNVLRTEVVSEGKSGKDIVLTIDMELQLAVEKILEQELWKAKKQPNTELLDRAYVVLLNPHTGEVLSMAGKQIARDEKTGKLEMQDHTYGTISSSYSMGSSVKGATILTGYKTGVNQVGTYYLDIPLKIKDTPPKGSWSNKFGTLNEIRALRVSSNVYMFKTAIAIGNGEYEPNQPLRMDTNKAFDVIRQSFTEFGLGTRTGIDLPNEQIGFRGPQKLPGFLLDLVIGQYDTYTPMQIAQYVATIANGGYRVQPRIVKEIRETTIDDTRLGPIIQEIEPTVLNRIDLKPGWLENVQEGFRQVMQHPEGTAARRFKDAPYSPAGKTGTAEAFYDGPERRKYQKAPEVMNLSLVAYAPHKNPEVAMAVVVPWAYQGKKGHTANYEIGRNVLDVYFKLKKTNVNH
ncbi:penicillin-binding protein 2 (plasmid) [Bacillus sp. 31A1R]|uniref:serine-type D-Ala-D-Ala carboxypeptidase n=1 Tax=Robertmurraya mangrovi TaxID=3098077 RepID=A0ABU5IUZ9_9BACI|nr:penicillin-binding protein 2 [Bacillus sp. 31A1R]MDZ5470982.1 penicillin-binding protein 2 [Bacillus sp. 31A1R]